MRRTRSMTRWVVSSIRRMVSIPRVTTLVGSSRLLRAPLFLRSAWIVDSTGLR
jgi:hypothetical protein